MTLSAELQNPLSQILSSELDCARSLMEILQREHKALKSRDPDQVLSISREKQQAVEEMQGLARQRDHLLASFKIPGGTAGIKRLLQHDTDSVCSTLWKDLAEIATELREQNEVNGGILALSQRHNNQALDILCGRTHNRNTYGAKGQYNKEAPGHSLAKA
ncbi:flagella synthesis protein FlgN [Sedimenticola sp.]|uniref:flagella synthesis protein FlgN n=1 Tax=Sedimenticola sp. TaxID=1940285 RepID=UPI003D0CCF51